MAPDDRTVPDGDLSRRAFARQGLGLAAVALGWVACGKPGLGDDTDTDGATDDTDPTSDDTDTDLVVDTDGGSDTDVGWATGGTAAMAETYPDPFEALGATCALTCSMTLGPCYGETFERRDISEAYPTGLPLRLGLRVVDAACQPIAGAAVDVWHTAPNGLYSGADTDPMCTNGDDAAEAGHWFRGVQTTDAEGKVFFHTCFPGWYPGRTIHVHLQVRVGADAYVTSQVFFPQSLTRAIFASHPEYEGFGQPNTTNDEDNVLGGEDATPYTVDWRKTADGVLHAWKTITIRTDLDERLCRG